jgi:hypothetical protein
MVTDCILHAFAYLTASILYVLLVDLYKQYTKGMVMNRKSKGTFQEIMAPKSRQYGEFWKSSLCNGGACVEVARLADGAMLVRDSKDAGKETLKFTRSEWTMFTEGVKNNEFNAL